MPMYQTASYLIHAQIPYNMNPLTVQQFIEGALRRANESHTDEKVPFDVERAPSEVSRGAS